MLKKRIYVIPRIEVIMNVVTHHMMTQSIYEDNNVEAKQRHFYEYEEENKTDGISIRSYKAWEDEL